MNKFRTVSAIIIMVLAAVVGLFVGAAFNESLNGSILFALISGLACVIYAIDNKE